MWREAPRYAIWFLSAIGGQHHPELSAKRTRLNSRGGVPTSLPTTTYRSHVLTIALANPTP
jgi:hypothetical protein